MATTKIIKYQVQYASNKFPPRIWLRGDSGWIGQAVFRPNGSNLPNDTEGNLNYHQEDFQNVLDLRRNEDPVYYSFVGSGANNENAIRTYLEDVGEGEN